MGAAKLGILRTVTNQWAMYYVQVYQESKREARRRYLRGQRIEEQKSKEYGRLEMIIEFLERLFCGTTHRCITSAIDCRYLA